MANRWRNKAPWSIDLAIFEQSKTLDYLRFQFFFLLKRKSSRPSCRVKVQEQLIVPSAPCPKPTRSQLTGLATALAFIHTRSCLQRFPVHLFLIIRFPKATIVQRVPAYRAKVHYGNIIQSPRENNTSAEPVLVGVLYQLFIMFQSYFNGLDYLIFVKGILNYFMPSA